MSATILLAEDNDVLRRVLALGLRDEGYAVIETREASDALAILGSEQTIDVVISDVSVPSAADTLTRAALRSRAAALPLIYISGHSLEFAADRYPMRPGAFFLAKPFSIDELLRVVRLALGSTTDLDIS